MINRKTRNSSRKLKTGTVQTHFRKIPAELIQKYKSTQIDAALEDKRKEDYKLPPPPSYIAFSGQGTAMSSGGAGGAVNLQNAKPLPVDASKPRTTLTFRLHDGTTHQIEVNTHEPTSNIYAYVSR